MNFYTKKQLEERYEKLPPVLKEAMFSADVANKIFGLGKKFGLTVEKTGFLAEQTGYVVLGLTKPEEFVQNLVDALEISADKAREIAKEVNHQIFYPLREALKAAHQTEVTEEKITKAEVAEKPKTINATPQAPYTAFQEKTVSATEPKTPQTTTPVAAIPPLTTKIPQIDLRSLRPTPPKPPFIPPLEKMKEAIFAPPIIEENQLVKNIQPQEPQKNVGPQIQNTAQPNANKKEPYGGFDPYKEVPEQ